MATTAMRCTIKPMTLADYDEALLLWQSTEGVGLNESDTRTAIASYLKRNRGMSFVARSGKKLVGAVLCGHDGRRGYLYHLGIAPSHRRKGTGTKLVARCLAALKRCDILKCNIFVYTHNAAGDRFWRANGWEKRLDLCMAQKDLGSSRAKRGC
jgi:ribosomal protein S18 acetylase RimI-like enzyme